MKIFNQGDAMTAIAGLIEGGKVYIGGDSAGVGGYNLRTRAKSDGKVFKNGPFLFGASGSHRINQLLRYAFRPPEKYPKQEIFKYMTTDFINAIRECFKKGGAAQKKDEEEKTDSFFLVGFERRLFEVECDYQVAEWDEPYGATGCGKLLVLASLFTSKGKPEERILTALQAAERFSAGVRGPFYIMSI